MLEGIKYITSDFPLSFLFFFLFIFSFTRSSRLLKISVVNGLQQILGKTVRSKKRRSDTNLATLFRKKSNCLPLVRQKRFSVQMIIHALSSKEYSQSIHNFLRPVSTRTKILHEKDGGKVVVHKNEVIWLNYQSSCGIWPAPSINLSFTALGFPFWNSSATAWGRYLSAIPQARSIGLSHLMSRGHQYTKSHLNKTNSRAALQSKKSSTYLSDAKPSAIWLTISLKLIFLAASSKAETTKVKAWNHQWSRHSCMLTSITNYLLTAAGSVEEWSHWN